MQIKVQSIVCMEWKLSEDDLCFIEWSGCKLNGIWVGKKKGCKSYCLVIVVWIGREYLQAIVSVSNEFASEPPR